MSHPHFCDYEGHFWECEGAAVRQFGENSGRTRASALRIQSRWTTGITVNALLNSSRALNTASEQLRQMGKFCTTEEVAGNARILASLQDRIHAAASRR